MRSYRLREVDISEETHGELAAYSQLVRKLLVQRGIMTKEEAERFINPDWDRDTHDPFLMKDMKKAAKRIVHAIQENESIMVFGDYDCDGIPGSVILHDLFEKVGHENHATYIPHRNNEGFGLNVNAIERFAKDGVQVLITVDCGIADLDQVAQAKKLGIDVVVTDHHLPIEIDGKEVLPKGYAVIDPKRGGDQYPDPMLSGAGVAFKLACAVLRVLRDEGQIDHIPEGWEKWLLDMAGISTIADMVPLTNENRAIAHYGLTVLRKSRRPGLQKLFSVARGKITETSEEDVAFTIAPRVNAASRIDDPRKAFDLFAASSEEVAYEIAKTLEKINNERKGHVAAMVVDAKKRLKKRSLQEVVVLGHASWKPGLLGLAAQSLIDDLQRPVFTWGYDGKGDIKGSCRSYGGVSLVELMRQVPDDTFIQFGGHAEAGGFSIGHDKIHEVEDLLSKELKKMGPTASNEHIVDVAVSTDDLTWNLYNEISVLAPFGTGNEKPVLLIEGAVVTGVKHFGASKNHLSISLARSSARPIEAIGFFMKAGQFDADLSEGSEINLVSVIERSTFRGFPELRVRIIDIV